MLALVFAAVPALLYDRFRAADLERQGLLLDLIRERGRLISRAIEPYLQNANGVPADQLQRELARYAGERDSLKLLLRPASRPEGGFFYVAASPPVAPEDLDRERRTLAEIGVLDRLTTSCEGVVPIAQRQDLSDGRSQLLTSLSPMQAPQGCWVLVGASILEGTDRPLGQPYWQTPEIRLALIVYLVLALLVLGILTDVLRSLKGFSVIAENVRIGRERQRFVDRNRVPELGRVAAAFDRMVDTLGAAARSIRDAAEENAHAFKTPIATIRQAVEQIRRRTGGDDARGQRAIAAIDTSLSRLDELVGAARQIDRGTADLLDPPVEHVDLSALAHGMAASYRDVEGPRVIAEAPVPVPALGASHLIETALENLVENAIGFSPPGGEVRLRSGIDGPHAVIAVIDRGPGVAQEDLARIFDRYYSKRDHQETATSAANFGLGLWIVKRNVEALGGHVAAMNTPGGGLTVAIRLPRAM
jgi:two-component system sensor histidine kinase ChvG